MTSNPPGFSESYRQEIQQLDRQAAPMVKYQHQGAECIIPVALRAVSEREYAQGKGEDRMPVGASDHELTIGIVCNEDEMEAAESVISEYMNHPRFRGRLTTLKEMSKTLDQLKKRGERAQIFMINVGAKLAQYRGTRLPGILAGDIMDKMKKDTAPRRPAGERLSRRNQDAEGQPG